MVYFFQGAEFFTRPCSKTSTAAEAKRDAKLCGGASTKATPMFRNTQTTTSATTTNKSKPRSNNPKPKT